MAELLDNDAIASEPVIGFWDMPAIPADDTAATACLILRLRL